jgi:hypothetical protein
MTDQLIKDFNSSLGELLDFLKVKSPESIILKNVDVVKSAIDKNPEKPIEQFVIYVLKYKDQIDKGDEDFFLKKDYADDIKGVKDKSSSLADVLSFKTIWGGLKDDDKNFIKMSMQILAFCAQQYFVAKYCSEE